MADVFKWKTVFSAAQDQLHPGNFTRSVMARAPLAVGVDEFNIFVIAQGSWRNVEPRAHFFETQVNVGHRISLLA